MERSFTLIELLIVIGIIVIVAGIVIVAINPARQLAGANNTRRRADITAILNAVYQNIVDNKGRWNCSVGGLPQKEKYMRPYNIWDPETGYGYDICNCLVPKYIAEMPFDPVAGGYYDCNDYNTGYTIYQDSVTKRVTISAPYGQPENGNVPQISVTR